MTTTLPSRNEEWGFFGTTHQNFPGTAAVAFADASRQLVAETGASAEGARDFLDSRHGRHFAEMVNEHRWLGLEIGRAVEKAIERHQRWAISYRESREHGIPHRAPYLTGWVNHFAIMAEVEDAA